MKVTLSQRDLTYYRVPHDVERVNPNSGVGQDFTYTGNSNGKPRQVVLERGVPLPEVYRLDNHSTVLDCNLQWFWRELNPHLSPEKFCTLLGNELAWTNGTGFPGNKNCILQEDMDAEKYPRFDQARICGGAIITGNESGGYLWVDTTLVTMPINQVHWYYGTSVRPDGKVQVIQRQGDDGMYGVRIPLFTTYPVRIPLSELHKLPMGFFPDPAWLS